MSKVRHIVEELEDNHLLEDVIEEVVSHWKYKERVKELVREPKEGEAVEKFQTMTSNLTCMAAKGGHYRIKAKTSDLAEALDLTPRQVGQYFPKNLSPVGALEVYYRLKTLSQFKD